MSQLTESLKSELTRLDQEIAALEARRSKVAELLAPVLLGGGKAKGRAVVVPTVGSASLKAAAKTKGWPKGMPRDKAKRAEWFKTEDGQAYLAANPGTEAKA